MAMGGELLGSLRVLAAVEEFENIELFEKGSYAIRMHVETNDTPGWVSSSRRNISGGGSGGGGGGGGTVPLSSQSLTSHVRIAVADANDAGGQSQEATLAVKTLHELLRGGTPTRPAVSSGSSSSCLRCPVLSNAATLNSPRAKNLTSDYRAGHFAGSGQLTATGAAQVSAQTNPFYVTYKRDMAYFDTAISCTAHAPLRHLLQPNHAPLSLRLELLMLHKLDKDDGDESKGTAMTETEILATRTINIWDLSCKQRVWAGRVEFDFLHVCSISVMVSCLLTGITAPTAAPSVAPPSSPATRLDESVQRRLSDALHGVVAADNNGISRFLRLRAALTALYANMLQAVEEQYDAHHLYGPHASRACRGGSAGSGTASSIVTRLASVRGMLRGILASPVPVAEENREGGTCGSASVNAPTMTGPTSGVGDRAVVLRAVRLFATQLGEVHEELDALVAVLHTAVCFNHHAFHHAKAACTQHMQGLLAEGVYVEDLPTGRLVTEAGPEFGGHRPVDLAQAVLGNPAQFCMQQQQMFTVVEEPTRPEESAVLFVQRLTAPWYHPRSSTAASSLASTRPATPRKTSTKGASTLAAGGPSPSRAPTSPGAASDHKSPTRVGSPSLAKRLSQRLLRSPQRHMYGRRTSARGAATQGMIDLAYPEEKDDDDGEDGLDIIISEDVFTTRNAVDDQQPEDGVVVVDTQRRSSDQPTASGSGKADTTSEASTRAAQQRKAGPPRSTSGDSAPEDSDTRVSDIDVGVLAGTGNANHQTSLCSSVDVDDACGGCGRGRWPLPRLRSSRHRKRNDTKGTTDDSEGKADGLNSSNRRPLIGSGSLRRSARAHSNSGGNGTNASTNSAQNNKNDNPYHSMSPRASSSTRSRAVQRRGTSARKRPARHASLLRVLLATQLQNPLATAAAACAPFPPAVAAALADTRATPHPANAPNNNVALAADMIADSGKGHLFVCVHGLEGNQYDLRNMRLKIQQWLPKAVFLMWSEEDTHRGVAAMAKSLVEEIESHVLRHNPTHISFIGHSLGNLVVRQALCSPQLDGLVDFDGRTATAAANGPVRHCSGEDSHGSGSDTTRYNARKQARRPSFQGATGKAKLHAYISLCAPHCGAVHLSGLVSTGLWFMSKLTRSVSIPELQLKDGGRQLRDTVLYRLRHNTRLRGFHHIVLVASPQDGYVSLSSALLTPEPRSGSSAREAVFEEMRTSLLREMLSGSHTTLTRCQVVFPPSKSRFSLASAIGRAAHVAMLDSDRFLAKFVLAHLHVLVRPPPDHVPAPPPPHTATQTSIV